MLNEGTKYGIIGRNGIGKSTLLRYIAAHRIIGFPSHISTMLVEQETRATEKTALETVIDADTQRTALLQEKDALLMKTEDDAVPSTGTTDTGSVAGIGDRLSEIFAILHYIEADTAEERAREILQGLQFSSTRMLMPTKELSGGWRMRVALARALFVQVDAFFCSCISEWGVLVFMSRSLLWFGLVVFFLFVLSFHLWIDLFWARTERNFFPLTSRLAPCRMLFD